MLFSFPGSVPFREISHFSDFLVSEVYRKPIWRLTNHVSVYKCLKVIFCTHHTGTNAWQWLMTHTAVHFTASRFPLWANRRRINFMTIRKTTTLFHNFAWRRGVEESATFIKNHKMSLIIFTAIPILQGNKKEKACKLIVIAISSRRESPKVVVINLYLNSGQKQAENRSQ